MLFGDKHLNNGLLLNFLVAETESVTFKYKLLQNVHGVSAVNKSTGSHWASQIVGSRKGQAKLSDARHSGQPKTTVTQVLLQRAVELIQDK
ncbi:hypothetical protein Cfor_10643 [Coptotermes formosanus]|uniref:Uncharacterized protein n=1 Tax=Coptotermes formosanus TaxID=36987 RepID=A0A6L2Q0P5_COPFO|nr:hypothetical protein Cfor_10643 [Coptotermes formosanus]